jgi:hypothetical protein
MNYTVRKWIIIVGSPSGVALVTAQYPDEAAVTYPDAVTRDALTSLAIREAPTRAEQVAALPFIVPTSRTFRVAGTVGGNGVALTDGPNDTDPNHEHASFVATLTDIAPEKSEREAFARSQFLAMRAIQINGIESANDLVIEGVPAHEIRRSAKTRTGVPLKVVLWTLFYPSSTLLLMGNTRPERFDQVFQEFITIRNGFRLK